MALEKEAIYNKLADEVSERFDVPRDKVEPSLNLITDVNADSIDFVELVLEVEDMFNVEISDDDVEKLDTLQKTVDYIYDHQED
ncbi:acyl carrier protein [Convivina intestini]|uniref:Acyl carrier protein n=1 Tax=Convivina intestini TaxID=1505726 RepID=A0A2U1DCI0_9LACO|nr:acyl carrier protein [Convivina intestini]PVY85381.1 acyl carrier protein [Convivina intestini]CAH1850746.1 Acyl carrier protein [Convivina intestini]CAH1853039.1 Acyl carrier protein [Convivina intestini]SDB85748.1 acyl carrier protein [Leuconostocaceae bacterium R-53105]